MDRLQNRADPTKLLSFGSYIANLFDCGARYAGLRVFQPPVQQHVCEELNAENLLECIQEFSSNRTLRPIYTENTFQWILNALRGKRRLGKLIGRQVRKDDGQRLGYYLYYANPNKMSQVLHVSGRTGNIGKILQELAYDAWTNGAVALSGWLDPYNAEEMATHSSYLKYDYQTPLLIQSTDPTVELAVGSGRAFLTPLEGEWSLWSHEGVIKSGGGP